MKLLKNKKTLMYIIFIWIISYYLSNKTFQNDTFYTIKIGEYISNNGIDMLDHFSFHNIAYTYPHWLYDTFIYFIYKIGGFTGIYISTICLFLILLFSVYKTSIKLTNKITISAFASVFCALASGSFITARAQLLTYILFVLEILCLEMFTKTEKKKYGIFLFLISLLICNIHVAVWPFFFILFLPYLAEAIISKIRGRNSFIRKTKDKFLVENINIKPILIIMLLCILTGLLTPIKDTPYTYLIKTMMGNSQEYIKEHQMVNLTQSIFTIIIVVETMFLALFNKAKMRDIFLILGLSFMSIISIRHIALLGVIGSICFARTFSIFTERLNFDIDEKILEFLKKKIVILISFILVISFAIFMMNKQLKKPYVDPLSYPTEAVKFIKKNLDYKNIRMFNDYNYGSYLLFNDIPVFIDSRADLYTKEFSGLERDIFDDYEYSVRKYDEVMEYYDFTHAMTITGTEIYQKISSDKKYKNIYTDPVFSVFEKVGENTNE